MYVIASAIYILFIIWYQQENISEDNNKLSCSSYLISAISIIKKMLFGLATSSALNMQQEQLTRTIVLLECL
jgi:hypothetical protein